MNYQRVDLNRRFPNWKRCGGVGHKLTSQGRTKVKKLTEDTMDNIYHRRLIAVWRNPHLWYITTIMIACSIFYYLDFVIELMGWLKSQWWVFYTVHDSHRLLFFIPVLYAAYIFRVRGVIVTALISALVFLPRALFMSPYPEALLRTIIFVILLGVVGVLLSRLLNIITERQRAEEDLRESEEKYRELADFLPQTVFEFDERGNFTFANRYGFQTFGYTLEDFDKGLNVLQMLVPEDRDRAKENIQRVLSGEVLGGNEYTALRKDGSTFPAIIYSAPIINGNKTVGLRGFVIDITERKRTEEEAREAHALAELNKLWTELLANVSHELRSPLATIKGYSTMLLDYEAKLERAEKRNCLKFIDKATDRLTGLIDQLLDSSQLDSGIVETEMAPTSISNLIQGAIFEAQVRAPTRPLILNLPKRLPRLKIDARRIRQVLDNLIDNAIKYSRDGTEVMVSACRVGGELVVSVTDQGVGIPAEDLPKVFDRMYRVRQRQVMETVGAGLGLSICKKVTEAHGGRIWIESEEGKGTTCFFTLPLNNNGNGHDE